MVNHCKKVILRQPPASRALPRNNPISKGAIQIGGAWCGASGLMNDVSPLAQNLRQSRKMLDTILDFASKHWFTPHLLNRFKVAGAGP